MNAKKLTAGKFFAELGRAVCYLFLFLLCQALVSTVFTLAAQIYIMLNPDQAIDIMELVLACTDQISIISGVATLVILMAFFLLRRKNPFRESGFHFTPGRFVVTAIAVTPLLYAVVSFVLGLLPEAWLESYAEASASLNQTGLLITIATVVVAPIVEEVTFRGLIQTRLNRIFPGWLAVLLSSLLFGICHAHPVWIAYAFVLGVIFGFMDLRARSIWPSLAAHVIFNGIGQIAVYLPQTESAATLFMGALVVVGAVLCVLTILYRALRPLKSGAT